MAHVFFIFLTSAICFFAQARPIQIIHTNDLHSHFDRSDNPELGGYARVKTIIDNLKAQAKAAGIETLTLDAGDFSEGSEFYFADEGNTSWEMMNLMGFDAVTLGNHDWEPGAEGIDRILERTKPSHALLSANFKYKKKFQNIQKNMRSFAQFSRAGLKITVLGLSTNESVYKWYVGDGTIDNPQKVAKKWMPELLRHSDAVIALTHLGVQEDVSLVNNVPGFDLVVGGHSHTSLFQPVYAINRSGNQIPVVQTGAFGKFVGDLLVDIEPGQPLKVLRYQLVPVVDSTPADQLIANAIADARKRLEDQVGYEWLYQKLGYSEIPLECPAHTSESVWGNLEAEGIRQAVKADIGFDSAEFFGDTQSSGEVTREKIIQYYPRSFDPRKKTGWNVWTIHAPGEVLKKVIEIGLKSKMNFVLAGLTYDLELKNNQPHPKNFRVGGKKLGLLKFYRVAVSEGIGKGINDNFFYREFLRPHDSGIPIWVAIEQRLADLGGVVKGSEGSLSAPNY